MDTVAATISVLRWASERAGFNDQEISRRFPKWSSWLDGTTQPTMRQLESFAQVTYTSIGYFFLPEPPVLLLPVPDFRTLRNEALKQPSSALLDVLYLCQQRQDWYRQYARIRAIEEIEWIGSATLNDATERVAHKMRDVLGMTFERRRKLSTWSEALRNMITQADELGVLVMSSSVVGSNSHRKLDVEEFRGFVLSDKIAPLIFLNAADSKSAIMFTLAHELAHLWLGSTGISNSAAVFDSNEQTEAWCNEVAAELLVPIEILRIEHQRDSALLGEIQRLARFFKVSTLVVLRRLYGAELISQQSMRQAYRMEENRIREYESQKSSGGDFYRTLGSRTSKRFARAMVASTLEGLTSFPEAFRMLGMRSATTLFRTAKELGVVQ